MVFLRCIICDTNLKRSQVREVDTLEQSKQSTPEVAVENDYRNGVSNVLLHMSDKHGSTVSFVYAWSSTITPSVSALPMRLVEVP